MYQRWARKQFFRFLFLSFLFPFSRSLFTFFFPTFFVFPFSRKKKVFFLSWREKKVIFLFPLRKESFFSFRKESFFSFSNWQSQKLEYFTLLVLVFRFLTPTSKKDVLSHSQNSTNMCIYTSTSNVIF